eukprot:scaffold57714_cov66-Phaeocystis_antarctica.AAC.7
MWTPTGAVYIKECNQYHETCALAQLSVGRKALKPCTLTGCVWSPKKITEAFRPAAGPHECCPKDSGKTHRFRGRRTRLQSTSGGPDVPVAAPRDRVAKGPAAGGCRQRRTGRSCIRVRPSTGRGPRRRWTRRAAAGVCVRCRRSRCAEAVAWYHPRVSPPRPALGTAQ